MQKPIKIVLIFMCLALLSGCAVNPAAQAKSDSLVIANINGTDLTLGEFNAQYQNVIGYYQSMGVDLTSEEYAEDNKALRRQFLDEIIKATVYAQKTEEYGLDVYTEEEQKALDEAAQKSYDSYYNSFLSEYPELTPEQARPVVLQQLKDNGISLQAIKNTVKQKNDQQRLKDYATQSIEVTEENIRSEYESYTEKLKSQIEAGSQFFISAWNNNLLLTYRPGGYCAYLWLMFPLAEEQENELNALQKSADPTYEAKRAEYLSALQADAQQALDELNGGAVFDTLFNRIGAGGYYGVDSIPQSIGYIIGKESQDIYPEVIDAAISLKSDGDFSGIVAANDGLYIIKRVQQIEEGDVPFEEVKDLLRESALESKKDLAFQLTTQIWIAQAETTIYEENLN